MWITEHEDQLKTIQNIISDFEVQVKQIETELNREMKHVKEESLRHRHDGEAFSKPCMEAGRSDGKKLS